MFWTSSTVCVTRGGRTRRTKSARTARTAKATRVTARPCEQRCFSRRATAGHNVMASTSDKTIRMRLGITFKRAHTHPAAINTFRIVETGNRRRTSPATGAVSGDSDAEGDSTRNFTTTANRKKRAAGSFRSPFWHARRVSSAVRRRIMRNRASVLVVLAAVAIATLSAARAAAAPVDVSIAFFHQELAPHGRWVAAASYGNVWIPGGVAAGWEPYVDGEWVYSDYGWTWVASDPWGDIPYPYGTW